MRVALLLALLFVACSKAKETSPAPSPSSSPILADAVVADASAAAAPPPKLPGALYFRRGDALVKLEAGAFVTDFADAGAPLFPSTFALPDGRVVGIASKGDGEAGSEQLVLIGPGTKVERIGPASTQVRNPAVDPAGAWIVIEAKTDPHSQLIRIDLATQTSTRLTNDPQGNFTPAVLDAKTIVFASSRDGDSEIYKLDLATKKPTRITAFHRDDWSPRVSPDGKTIAFLSDREGPPRIFLVNPDGTKLRRLTQNTDASDEDAPAWSPDGTSIAFLRAGRLVVRALASPAGGRTGDDTGSASGGIERVLTPDGARDAEPAWSPDGHAIAVSRGDNIWVLPLAGGDPVAVTSTGDARLPRWHAK